MCQEWGIGTFFIDHEVGGIIHLVASVCVWVCMYVLGVQNGCCFDRLCRRAFNGACFGYGHVSSRVTLCWIFYQDLAVVLCPLTGSPGTPLSPTQSIEKFKNRECPDIYMPISCRFGYPKPSHVAHSCRSFIQTTVKSLIKQLVVKPCLEWLGADLFFIVMSSLIHSWCFSR